MLSRVNLFGNIKKSQLLWVIILVIPALYLNLGLLPLKGDEAIRAVVTLEMMLSGDYITPTLTGEIYLNKPPLYNWILAGFFKVFDGNSEFLVRLPTTIFLLIYCFTIFLFVSRHLGKQAGILSSLVFLTCGRVFFWDSYLGLIDITYSWIMFLNFMLIWQYFEKKSYLKLFIFSYFLTAVGFMLKGVPTLAFQVITLLTLFIYDRRIKVLFQWQHFAGIALFLGLTSIYYFLYSLKNPEYLDNLFMRLVSESTQKSALGSTLEKTFRHLIVFPFEIINHFLPWILLVIVVFHKGVLKRAFTNRFVAYCALVFIFNIVIYWFSPTTYPRYLLMLVPLAFIVFLYAAKVHALLKTINYKIAQYLFASILFILAGLSILLPLIFARQIPVDHLYIKLGILLIIEIIIFTVYFRKRSEAGLFYYLVLILVVCRLSFDMFMMPYRESKDWLSQCRSDAIMLGQKTRGEKMYYMADTITIHNVYYLTRERNEILKYNDKVISGPYYILDNKGVADFKAEFSMRTPYHYSTYYAGKFRTKKP